MSKQTHPTQGAQGLNTPPKRYVNAVVYRGKEVVHEIEAGITQFQILPNGLAIQIFKETDGDEFTVCINSDTTVRITESLVESAAGVVIK